MTQKHFKIYAEHFYNLGLNIAYVSSELNQYNLTEPNILKSPSIDCKDLVARRQTENEFDLNKWDKATGLGVVLGNNDLMAIDIDCCIDFDLVPFICQQLGIPQDYKWIMKSGTHCGFHVILSLSQIKSYTYNFAKEDVDSYYPKPISYFRDELLEHVEKELYKEYDQFILQNLFGVKSTFKTLFNRIEFIWRGFLILPPSFHESGLIYEFINGIPNEPPLEINLEKLYELRNLMGSSKKGLHSLSKRKDAEIAEQSNLYNNDMRAKYVFFDIATKKLNQSEVVVTELSWIVTNIKFCLLSKEQHIVETETVESTDSEIHKLVAKPMKHIISKFLTEINRKGLELVTFEEEVKSKIIHNLIKKLDMNIGIFKQNETLCVKETFLNKFPDTGLPMSSTLEEIYSHIYNKQLKINKSALSKIIASKAIFEKIIP